MNVVAAPWFLWSVGLAVGLPLTLIVFTEWYNSLQRRHSNLAGPVNLLRVYLLPLGALWLLLVKATDVSGERSGVRIIATLFGFVLLLLLLSGLNAVLFRGAPEGSWRNRLPTILFDVARLVLIGVGLTLILSYVWGVKIGGLFAALGVTSVVVGLMLQNSVGQIVSGLFLLFEQPFRIGDWLDTPTARGRVVEVNWRAVHIETGDGLQIMPNSVLAGLSFTNLSRPTGAHRLRLNLTFSPADPPDRVCALLTRVAAALPPIAAGPRKSGAAGPAGAAAAVVASAAATGGGGYRVSLPVGSPADESPVQAVFLRWLWYAARREGLRLDGAADDYATPERVTTAFRQAVAPTLRLTEAEQAQLLAHTRLLRYGTDEPIHAVGDVPDELLFLTAGQVRLAIPGPGGATTPVVTLGEGALLGLNALTREPNRAVASAIGEVTVLEIGREHLERFVAGKPTLLADLGRMIDDRRAAITRADASLPATR